MMVRDYGMSRLGPVALSGDQGPSFLGIKGPESRTYSDQTAMEVDREVQSLVVEAQERARDIVREHREKLDALAARLLAVEVVEEEEMARLWGPKVERPGGFMGRGHAEAPPENPNRPRGNDDRVWPVTHAAAGAVKPGDGD
jgi:cell division protease FtsH